MVDPGAFAPFNFAESYGRGLQIRQQREQTQNQHRLGDLLPQAVNGDTSAMEQIAHIDPRMFMQLNQQQREKAQAEIEDLTGAVRWAMQDPAQQAQRWNQVVDFYSSHIPDVAQYRDHPEMAETALMKLGQMGSYLKAGEQPNQPSSVREYEYAKQQGFNGSYMDFQNQMGSPIMVDNGDGTKTLYPRSMLNGGGQQQGASPPPPPPGFVPDQGGPSQGGSGGFRY